MKSLKSAISLVILAVSLALVFSQASIAKPRAPIGDDLIDLELCRSYADPEKNPLDVDVVDDQGQLCCSKELNYCIDCSRSTGQCKLKRYRVWPGRGNWRPQAPGQGPVAPISTPPSGFKRPGANNLGTGFILTFPQVNTGN